MKKIVLIEDNLEVRENIEEILELADYDVSSAENGRLGVGLVKTQNPDLIICDIMMPELDGYGVLHILSRNPSTASIPFIFLTAKADKSDVRKGMNLGADDYLTKPFEETELLDAIEMRLKRNNTFKREFSDDINGLNEFISEARGLEQLKDLSEDRKVKSYKKKETIYREGDYANFLYFIISGKVKSVKVDSFGKELVTDILEKGEYVGYMAMLEGGDYKETTTAMENTELAIIPKEDFLTLIEKNRDVANRFIQMLANNVSEKEERLLQLAYSPVRERVADALLKLIDSENQNEIRMSRDDLAAIAGTATETLIRTLADFKSEKLIESEGRGIKILDKKGLQTASGV